jgi:ABC-type transport system involved in multi-copper enzyme maturation permease subunit
MRSIALVTLKGVFRDRVFQGICVTAILFLFIPAVATLSMRLVTEVAISLSLSLISFILLILAVFLAGGSLWKDMERRYTFSVLGLPLRRSDYLLGKFFGISLFLLLVVLLLWLVTVAVAQVAAGIYPPQRPVVWMNLFLAVWFDALKYILLVAVAFLFSTVSTSFFLPVFGTIAIYLVGSASQDAFEFVNSREGQNLPAIVRGGAKGLYYFLPNFSAFDLKFNAIYGLQVSAQGLFLTFGYFVVYTAIVLLLAVMAFSRRELN